MLQRRFGDEADIADLCVHSLAFRSRAVAKTALMTLFGLARGARSRRASVFGWNGDLRLNVVRMPEEGCRPGGIAEDRP